MVKLNRTTEYGLMALKHMSLKQASAPGGVTSARELSESYGLPFEITAKTLQRMKDTGLIESAQGARGGYLLMKRLEDVSLSQFVEWMEGPTSVVMCCQGKEKNCVCEFQRKCEIQPFMTQLNERVTGLMAGIRLADIVGEA